MTRFAATDLSAYPIEDVLDVLDFEAYLTRDKADFQARWNALRAARPDLPAFDTLDLESEPAGIVLQSGAYRYMLALARYNDRVRQVTLAGATGRMLDHLGITYYQGAARRTSTAADGTVTTEDDDTFRDRLALSPESWSTCGPEGAYLYWALSADVDVLDVNVYAEEDGYGLAPEIQMAVLSRTATDGIAPPPLIAKVLAATSRKDRRPLGDLVTARSAERLDFEVDYTLYVRAGAGTDTIGNEVRRRLESYCSGRRRWIGDGLTGPVELVGRRLRCGTMDAAALVDGVVEVVRNAPLTDVNPPILEGEPAHLWSAPRLTHIGIGIEYADDRE